MVKISIIMPIYNCEKFIKQAVESVLSQTFKDFELIIVFDKSTDNTEKIIDSFSDKRINIIKNKVKKGFLNSLNLGVSLAKGKYIARIDGDDYRDNKKLEEQFVFLENHLDVGVVGTNVFLINDNNKILSKYIRSSNDYEIRKKIFIQAPYSHSSVMFRNVGYRYTKKIAEDYELWLRIGTKYKFYNIKNCLTYIRVRQDSITGKQKFKDILSLLKTGYNYRKNYKGFYQTLPFYIIQSVVRLLIPRKFHPFFVSETFSEIIRFIIMGGIYFVGSVALFSIFFYLFKEKYLSLSIVWIITCILSFIGNKNLVFLSKKGLFIKYLLFSLFMLLINYFMMFIFSNICGIKPFISVILIGLTSIPINFIFQKKIIFNNYNN